MSKTVPRDYQIDCARMARDFNFRVLIGDDMGLGKTFEALYSAERYLPDDPPGPIVVVVPANLRTNWKREAAHHFGLRAEILYGQSVPRDQMEPLNPNQIFVIGYEVLTQPRRDGERRNVSRDWVTWLRKLQPRLIIGDEIQYIKNAGSARARAFKKLCKGVPHIMGLSGTPMTNSPKDLYTILNILVPEVFNSAKTFYERFTNPVYRPWGTDYKGARNLDELHRLLRKYCMIRRLKSEVLKDLPTKTLSVVPIEVDRKEYEEAESNYIGWLGNIDSAAALRQAAAEELNRVMGLRRLAGRLKIAHVIRWVRDFMDSTDEKLLLGAVHHAVTEPIMHAFEDDGAVLLDGTLSDREKTVARDKFNGDRRTRLMVANLVAGGIGWSCKSTSKVMICEMPWTPGELNQFVDRIHGLERGLPGVAAMIWLLVAEDTVEEDLCQLYQTKQDWLDQTLDGRAGVGGLPILDYVRERIKERGRKKRLVKK